MERAKSPREIPLGVIPHKANFWPLAEGQNVVNSHRGNLLYLRKCSLSFEKSLMDRHRICGKMDTQKQLNAPLHADVDFDEAATALLDAEVRCHNLE
jgi:hypothetical protein